MIVITSVKEMHALASQINETIGFVPTMGALHNGHLSLIKAAKRECEIVIVSIYVNPTQFGPKEDLSKYPRTMKNDLMQCENLGVDIVFAPSDKEMYPKDYRTYVNVEDMTKPLCGKSRPGHFRGVTTIVAKLFNIVKPKIAYFGQKDYQQSLVIKKMVEDLNIDIAIKVLPIIRENDDLAMSSRNAYLNKEERKAALILNKTLKLAEKMIEKEKNTEKIKRILVENIKKEKLAKIDYLEILDKNNLMPIKTIKKDSTVIAMAVFIGKTRLIDNILI